MKKVPGINYKQKEIVLVKKFSLVKDELFTKVQEKIKRLIERKKSKKKIQK